MQKSATNRGEFTAADIELITGINIEAQKDLRKRIAALGVKPLGHLRGHWRYSWTDLCFLKLVEAVRGAGLTVDNALEFILRRESDVQGMRLRSELGRVIAAHLVGFPLARDVCLYIPIAAHGWSTLAIMPVEFDESRPIAGRAVELDLIFSQNTDCVHVAVVNVSRIVRQMIDHIGRMEPLLSDLERHRQTLREVFDGRQED